MVCAYYYTIAIRYALSICTIRHTAYETHGVVQSWNYGCGCLIAEITKYAENTYENELFAVFMQEICRMFARVKNKYYICILKIKPNENKPIIVYGMSAIAAADSSDGGCVA